MQRRIAGRPWWQALVIGGCVVVAVMSAVALGVLGSRPELLVVNVTAYSLGYLVAGSMAWSRRPDNPVGPVMLAISVAGSLSFFSLLPDPLVARVAGFGGSVANVLVVWVLLAAPSGHLAPGIGRLALGGFAAVVIAAAAISDLTVLRVAWGFGVVISLLLVALVYRRWATASVASRRSLTPVVIAGMTISLVHAMDFASGVFLIPVIPGGPIYWADTISRTLVPFGFLLGLLRLRMARGAVADLVVELGQTPAPERLREALAHALGDPSLEVVYWSPASRTYLDHDGLPADVDTGGSRAVTYLDQGGRPLAAIVHDPALGEDPGLVSAVAAAVRLAVDNERLAAEVRSQLDEVRASRSRIVEASDAERRRVERNLHDGAQQRLVALSLALRRARAQLPPDAAPATAAALDGASEQLASAMAELRELAKGIHPAILTEAGLGPALRSLARESPVEVTLRLELADDLADPISVAAYFVAAEALTNVAKYAAASHIDLTAESGAHDLRIEIRDDGVGGADPEAGSGLRGLSDRVAALGGQLDIRSPAGAGTRVVARLPLVAG
ncbi:MAG TPA: histidine kinase [Candidatus Limnocylindria bacterium]